MAILSRYSRKKGTHRGKTPQQQPAFSTVLGTNLSVAHCRNREASQVLTERGRRVVHHTITIVSWSILTYQTHVHHIGLTGSVTLVLERQQR
jgi:hypothetical protein